MRPVAIVVGLALALSLSGAALADTLRDVVIANGEKVGHLTAEVQGRVTTVDYAISNNGRGPKARERIEADASGMPVSWVVDGESLFGSASTGQAAKPPGPARPTRATSPRNGRSSTSAMMSAPGCVASMSGRS
jgi:hypothetical protein